MRIIVPALLAAAIAISGQLAAQGPADTAAQLLREANDANETLGIQARRAGFVSQTHITPDTEALAARTSEAYANALTDLAKRAALVPAAAAAPAHQRQLTVLKSNLTLATPPDRAEAAEVTQLLASMRSAYGRGKYCPDGEPLTGPSSEGDGCLDVEAVTKVLAESRDEKRVRNVWEGWHTISTPMKASYARFVELSNTGARSLGYADTGTMWRSRYDMPPDAFVTEMDRLWTQLRPLYLSLHAYVRTQLRATYGNVVPADGPIPAHLLGNIWAQEWGNLYDIVAPPRAGRPVDLTALLAARKATPIEMVRYGERFFTSLGFDPLPNTFWERSLFVKPRDREVVCHASAWNIDDVDDLRIKMCIDPTAEDFTTIHHELGHNFYQRAYNQQPPVLRAGANDGFHEAIGDTIALSVTPEYLVKIGLLDRAPDASGDIGLLLRGALDKLAFLPFGMVMDQWRWRVFTGEITPANYNSTWWQLREQYQGIRPPSPRGEQFFDPGAKYHIPANTPYARYFLSSVLQFQLHRALARSAGCATPLHRCSIYGSAAAGSRLKSALELGASRPWPDVLEALTGQREMDATAIAEYYAPLKTWLDQQNAGRKVGW
jgi:peptidyl-dipeptidase A